MDLYTPVTLPPHAITLETDSKVMMLGSCFAENVGGQLQMRMGNDKVDVNPFGVLYNPASIAQALRLLMRSDSKSIATDEKYIFHGQDGAWHSWLHSSHFSDMTKEGCLEKIASRLYSAKAMLKEATLLCITFGTTRHYVHNNIVVANCHKEPQRCFTESEMSLDELTAIWRDTIKALSAFNPKLRICLTVSPYRYKKYVSMSHNCKKRNFYCFVTIFATTIMQPISPPTKYSLTNCATTDSTKTTCCTLPTWL